MRGCGSGLEDSWMDMYNPLAENIVGEASMKLRRESEKSQKKAVIK